MKEFEELRKSFKPLCGVEDFVICSGNSDANCYRTRPSYAKKLVRKNEKICDTCGYKKLERNESV